MNTNRERTLAEMNRGKLGNTQSDNSDFSARLFTNNQIAPLQKVPGQGTPMQVIGRIGGPISLYSDTQIEARDSITGFRMVSPYPENTPSPRSEVLKSDPAKDVGNTVKNVALGGVFSRLLAVIGL